MCGIAGFGGTIDGPASDLAIGSRMAGLLDHRGPDDSGVWVDEGGGVTLAHRRLSIIDVSPAGRQPMQSHCGRYVIAFNGEIYNHAELRKALDAQMHLQWRGHSDTETLLQLIAHDGCKEALRRCAGMFAFALWDRAEHTLTLARDRLGEKPLYYGRVGRTFAFASELKAFRAHPAWQPEVDRAALTLLMRHGCVPAPYSIFKGIQKLLPGHLLTLTGGDDAPKIEKYWSARDAAERGRDQPFAGSREDAVAVFDRLLRQAIAGQMMSDVPLGAFLSGGVDSSTVVALMQTMSARPTRTFTIGFDDVEFNEATHAKAVARHLGTDHSELYVTQKDAQDVIPKLPSMYCEPFSDASQIPTSLIAQLARRSVTVALTGDAGDEIFSGYNRYALAGDFWNRVARAPQPLRKAAAKVATAVPPHIYDRAAAGISNLLPRRNRPTGFGQKVHKAAELLSADSVDEVYRRLSSHWCQPSQIVKGGSEPPTMLTGLEALPDLPGSVETMMFKDLVSYLPDDILVKVDRAAMAASLETRVPFLDHRLVEFSLTVPLSIMRAEGQSKWPLRQILYRHVSPSLIERPKSGFAVPIGAWLRGPLRDWAEGLLEGQRLKSEGFLESAPIGKVWQEHLSGRHNHEHLLWDVLMFQSWHEAQRAVKPALAA